MVLNHGRYRYFDTLIVLILCHLVYASELKYFGPRVDIATPKRGIPCKQDVIQTSLFLDVGSGPEAHQIQQNPNGFKVCFTGGSEVVCNPILGEAKLELINVNKNRDVCEVSAWIQPNDALDSINSAIGQADVVALYTPNQAIDALRARANGYGIWSNNITRHMEALRYFDLGNALMRAEPQQGSNSMVEAAAALGMASAWGLDGAKGALEELIWLSSDQTQPFPLFPCNYDGTIEVPLLEGGPKDKAVFAVPFYTQPDWSSARRVVAEHVGNGCEGHPLFDQCVSAAVLAVRQLISGHCGNLANLESVVAAHASNPSDINQHIRTLETLATETSSVLELGVRGCSSSWAFLSGILKSSASTPRLILNDIDDCFAIQFYSIVKHFNVAVEYYWQDDLTLELDQPVDLVFIDTYHIYGQLKRELKKFGPLAAKYIVMHDTTVDADVGEAIRLGDNVTAVLSSRPGWVEEDVVNGLWRAVTEFLDENADTWELVHRYTNNNGLTVLRRKHQEIEVTSSQVAAPPEEENSRRQWKGFY